MQERNIEPSCFLGPAERCDAEIVCTLGSWRESTLRSPPLLVHPFECPKCISASQYSYCILLEKEFIGVGVQPHLESLDLQMGSHEKLTIFCFIYFTN